MTLFVESETSSVPTFNYSGNIYLCIRCSYDSLALIGAIFYKYYEPLFNTMFYEQQKLMVVVGGRGRGKAAGRVGEGVGTQSDNRPI